MAAQRGGCLLAALLISVNDLRPGSAILTDRSRSSLRRSSPRQQDYVKPFYGTVYGETEDRYPEDAPGAVELLRFTTAYGTTLETVVDLTPYSPLLRSAARDLPNLSWFAFIDTWVGNESGSVALYMDNVTGKCSAVNTSNGNGWALSASLLFEHDDADAADAVDATADMQPYASVTLASGVVGSTYGIGDLTLIEATKDTPSNVKLDESVDVSGFASASVFDCPDGWSLQQHLALFLGQVARRTKELAPQGADALRELRQDMEQYLIGDDLITVDVRQAYDNGSVVGTYVRNDGVSPSEGAPIFLGGVFTDQLLEEFGGVWWNMSTPFEPVGEVISVKSNELVLKLNSSCLPQESMLNLPQLYVPKNSAVISTAKKYIRMAMELGQAASATVLLSNQSSSDADHQASAKQTLDAVQKSLSSLNGPVLLLDPTPSGPLRAVHALGKVQLESSATSTGAPALRQLGALRAVPKPSPTFLVRDRVHFGQMRGAVAAAMSTPRVAARAASENRVCVVAQEKSGLVLKRSFDMPLSSGSRVLAQLAITGHGWAYTTEQCGEYCHAVYNLKFNGRSAKNITQFRDDCKDNPIGEGLQHGTWWESRNGWCPGMIEPGLFVDVTDYVMDGRNEAELTLSVWSNETGQYEQYTNHAGFAFDDKAMLDVGFTLFAYNSSAVQAVRARPASTAAEKALRDGSSDPSQLDVPEKPSPPVLLQHKGRISGRSAGAERLEETPWDSLSGAPWYTWNSSRRGDPAKHVGKSSSVLKLFSDRLMQSNTRIIHADIPAASIPRDWRRLALHLRVQKPKNMDVDHWDRVASVGLLLNPDPPANGKADRVLKVHRATSPFKRSDLKLA